MFLDAIIIKRIITLPHHSLGKKKDFLLAKIYICIYRFIPLKPYQNCSQGFSFCHSYIPINRTGNEIHCPMFLEKKHGMLSGISRYPATLCEEVQDASFQHFVQVAR